MHFKPQLPLRQVKSPIVKLIRALNVGQSVLIIAGRATTIAVAISRSPGEYAQRKVIITDPASCESVQAFLVTMTASTKQPA